ncbi:hypothetical protein V5N11_003307 [Cardamine amara subsp. amara]|uniref:RNase H type-1 domain-containing protein n=1 Tax=Cardamine amara subsp. amara TaxID=228776 RepID=A0ABD1BTW4_CARAN
MSKRFEAELLSILWAVEGVKNLHFKEVIFESSSAMAMNAVLQPHKAPAFRNILVEIRSLLLALDNWKIETVNQGGNKVAAKFAASVTEEHRYQSYVAAGEPSWLSLVISSEARNGTYEL